MLRLAFGVLLSFLMSNCFAYFEDFKNVIRLTNANAEEGGYAVNKTYSYDKPLLVSYSYGENQTDGEWKNKLHLSLDGDAEDILIPVDIVRVGFTVGGDGDETTKMFNIPDMELPQSCDLVGTATVVLKDMWVWVPEYPAGYASGAKVVKVISSSKLRLNCDPPLSDSN